MWSGCGGNLNNFLSMYDCQRFCSGDGPPSGESMRMDDDGMMDGDGFALDNFHSVAFSLTGPLTRGRHGEEFKKLVLAIESRC